MAAKDVAQSIPLDDGAPAFGVGVVRAAAWAPSGICVATGLGVAGLGADGRRLWFRRLPAPCAAVSCSVTGHRVAAATIEGRVHVWAIDWPAAGDSRDDASEGADERDASADASQIAGASQGVAGLWAVDALRVIEVADAPVIALAPAGDALAIGDRAGVRIWDVETGAVGSRLEGTEGEITSVAMSADGALVAAVDYGGHAVLWDRASGAMRGQWVPESSASGSARALRGVAVSADGALVAAVGKRWTVWNVDAGVAVATGKAPGPLTCAAFSPDGARLVTGSARNRAFVWDVATGDRLRELRGHGDKVHSVAFSPDGARLLAASETVTLTDADADASADGDTDADARTLSALGIVRHVACAGAQVALADRQIATLWTPGAVPAAWAGHRRAIEGVAFAGAEAQTLLSWSARDLFARDVADGRVRYAYASDDGLAAALSPDGAALATARVEAGTCTVRVHDAQTGDTTREVASAPRSGFGAPEVAIGPASADGRGLALRLGGRVRLWWLDDADGNQGGAQRESQNPPREIDGPRDALDRDGALAWSGAQSQLVAIARDDGAIALWDVRAGRERARLRCADTDTNTDAGRADIGGLAFSPDGSVIAARLRSAPDVICLWDAAAGALRIAGATGPGDVAYALAFRADGARLAAGFGGDPGGLAIWDTQTGALVARREGQAVWSLAFAPDGRLLAGTGAGAAWYIDVP